jgi:hypothetical protein
MSYTGAARPDNKNDERWWKMEEEEEQEEKRERYKYDSRLICCEECKIRELLNDSYAVKNTRLGN